MTTLVLPRPQRECAACPVVDDHPRHVFKRNGELTRYHLDCCAAAGCPQCRTTLTTHKRAHGDQLIASLAAERAAGVSTGG